MCWEENKFQDQGKRNAYVYSSLFTHLIMTQILKENIIPFFVFSSATIKISKSMTMIAQN